MAFAGGVGQVALGFWLAWADPVLACAYLYDVGVGCFFSVGIDHNELIWEQLCFFQTVVCWN